MPHGVRRKGAQPVNETICTMRSRRSIRKYQARQIDRGALQAILEAGTYAPSAMGRQSARMVVVEDGETLGQLSRINAAIQGNPGADPFYGAPTLVAVLADPAATTADNADRDGALVMGNLMLAAASLGIGSCWINRAKETFALPEGQALLTKWGLPETMLGVGFCVLGYPADEAPPAAAPRRDGRIVWA